jgi:hypothetical protein
MLTLFDISIPGFAGVAPYQPNPAVLSPDWAQATRRNSKD